MRTLVCIAAFGILAALTLAGADGQDTGKRPPPPVPANAKTGPRPAAKPAPDANQKPPAPAGAAKKLAVPNDDADATDQYADDRAAILKSAVTFLAAYSDHDAGAVASLFSPDAEYVDEEGTTFRGRDEIEANLKSFFEAHPDSVLEMQIDSLRFVTPAVAIEDGSSSCTIAAGKPGHRSLYTVVHVKVDGKWVVASSREYVAKGQPEHALHLTELNWLLGDWVDQDDDSVVQFRCAASEDGHYLLRDFTVSVGGWKTITGTERIGWDPRSGKIRSWTFDSDGGHFEGAWSRDGEKWLLNSSGITSDGRLASGTAIFTPVNGHTMTWQVVNREIGGARELDSDEFTLVRTLPAPEK
jgi:uncharacterized protein (TIGR02246 family)